MINQTKYYKYHCATKGRYSQCRDWVFQTVLAGFNKQPITILEVGCLTDISGRYGNGNSTMFWAEYLEAYGGKLVSIDNNEQHIKKSHEILQSTFPDVFSSLVIGDAGGVIKAFKDNNFPVDFAYLDGSNNPMETLEQFELLREINPNCVILIDDFNEKGTEVMKKYPICLIFGFTHPHELGFYAPSIKETQKLINPKSPDDIMIEWSDFKE